MRLLTQYTISTKDIQFMFNKLKELASGAVVKNVVDKVTPLITEQLEKVKSLRPEQLFDDTAFHQYVTKPTWLVVTASLGGLNKLYPPFEEKFSGMMMHIRNEIVQINDGKITFADGFRSKLPQIMMDGLKNGPTSQVPRLDADAIVTEPIDPTN